MSGGARFDAPPGQPEGAMACFGAQTRRSLFQKYFIAIFVAVIIPLLAGVRARLGSATAISAQC